MINVDLVIAFELNLALDICTLLQAFFGLLTSKVVCCSSTVSRRHGRTARVGVAETGAPPSQSTHSVKANALAGATYLRARVKSALKLRSAPASDSRIVASAVLAALAALSLAAYLVNEMCLNGKTRREKPLRLIKRGPSPVFVHLRLARVHDSRVNKRTRNANFSSTDS